jgi:hypothetical protein
MVGDHRKHKEIFENFLAPQKLFFLKNSGNSLHKNLSTRNKPQHQNMSTRNKADFVPGRRMLVLRFVPCGHHLVLTFVPGIHRLVQRFVQGRHLLVLPITRNLQIFFNFEGKNEILKIFLMFSVVT